MLRMTAPRRAIGISLLALASLFLQPQLGSADDTETLPRGLGRSDTPAARPQPQQRGLAALVIGMDAYPEAPLQNAVADATAVAAALAEIRQVPVTRVLDADSVRLHAAVDAFATGLAHSGALGVVYFAGHGVQINGRNYLLPVDVPLNDPAALKARALALDHLFDRLSGAGANASLILLDACRDNPFTTDLGGRKLPGLARQEPTTGTLLVYATRAGEVAEDGPPGQHSPFAAELLERIPDPGPVAAWVNRIPGGVAARTGGRQIPLIVNANFDPDLSLRLANRADLWREPITGMELRWVPGGSYLMGCGGSWAGPCRDDETQTIRVRIEGFWIGATEVTQQQWRRAMGRDAPSRNRCEGCPVDSVAIADIAAFIAAIDVDGTLGLRLPTEAEWEYACRDGGREQAFCGGNGPATVAWYRENSGRRSHPVGRLAPTSLGLYDLSGNLWEWTCSIYAPSPRLSLGACEPFSPQDGRPRVVRGGSYSDRRDNLRATRRLHFLPSDRFDTLGFRLARPANTPSRNGATPAARVMQQPSATDAVLSRTGQRHPTAGYPGSPRAPVVPRGPAVTDRGQAARPTAAVGPANQSRPLPPIPPVSQAGPDDPE